MPLVRRYKYKYGRGVLSVKFASLDQQAESLRSENCRACSFHLPDQVILFFNWVKILIGRVFNVAAASGLMLFGKKEKEYAAYKE